MISPVSGRRRWLKTQLPDEEGGPHSVRRSGEVVVRRCRGGAEGGGALVRVAAALEHLDGEGADDADDARLERRGGQKV